MLSTPGRAVCLTRSRSLVRALPTVALAPSQPESETLNTWLGGLYSITNLTEADHPVWQSRDENGRVLGQLQNWASSEGARRWKIYNASTYTGTGADGFGTGNDGLARGNNPAGLCPDGGLDACGYSVGLNWFSMEDGSFAAWPITVACTVPYASRSELWSAANLYTSGNPFVTTGCGDVTTLVPIGDWDVSRVDSMRELFCNRNNFNADLSSWDVSRVGDMSGMFNLANEFGDAPGCLGNWDVSSVTNMRDMFSSASSFNGDLSGWDVSRVTSTTSMFGQGSSFNGDLSSWDVSSVTAMSTMFISATSFNSNLASWDISGVTVPDIACSTCATNNVFSQASSFNRQTSPFYTGGGGGFGGGGGSTTSPTVSPTIPPPTTSPTTSPTVSPPTTSPTPAPVSIFQAATASLSANITNLTAALLDGSAAEPAEVAELLAVAADSVSIWLAEVAEAGSGPSEEALPEELEAFGQAQEMVSNLTLLAAATLNTSVVSQGTSADGTVILTSAHATLESDKLSYPFFAPGFTGAAVCLGNELSTAAAAASPCLVPSAPTGASGGGVGVSSGKNTMILPAPRDIGVTGTSAHVGFAEFASPRFAGSVWSKVLLATVLGIAHNTPFSNAAKMRFNLTAATETASRDDDNSSNPCAFWDERHLDWNSTGCEHLGTVGGLVVMCECNHLTSFAVLTDANSATGAGNGLSEDEQHNLAWFVFVCVGISIGCLTVVILVYAVASELRTEAKVILLHLCVVYNLALILFLATATSTFDGDECIAVGAALHFALLSTFLWMLAEGHHLHQTFVNVFSQRRAQEGRQIAVYCSVAYGGPVVEVLLLVFMWPAAYERDDGLCFLSKETGAIWFFLGPALTVIVLNVYVLVQVSREVWGLGVLDQSDSRTAEIITKTKRAFKSSLAFGSILGITWVFGLLSLVVPDSVAFHYIFALCNALGGLHIFCFHLLKDPAVRNKVRTSTLGAMLGAANSPVNGKRKPKKQHVVVVRRKKGPVKFNGAWGGTGTGTDGASDGSLQSGDLLSVASAVTAEASLAEVKKPPSSPDPPKNGNEYVDWDAAPRLPSGDVSAADLEGGATAVGPSSNRVALGSPKLPQATRAISTVLQTPKFLEGNLAASRKPLKLQKFTSEGNYSAGSVRTEENDYSLRSTPEGDDDDNNSLASAPDEETDFSIGSAPEEKDSSSLPTAPRMPTEADHATMILPAYVPPPRPSGEYIEAMENTGSYVMVEPYAASTAPAADRNSVDYLEGDEPGDLQYSKPRRTATMDTLWDPAEAASAGEAIHRYNSVLDADTSRHSIVP